MRPIEICIFPQEGLSDYPGTEELMRLENYGVTVGKTADLVVLDCASAEQGIAELAVPLYGFKRGRMTFSRKAPW